MRQVFSWMGVPVSYENMIRLVRPIWESKTLNKIFYYGIFYGIFDFTALVGNKLCRPEPLNLTGFRGSELNLISRKKTVHNEYKFYFRVLLNRFNKIRCKLHHFRCRKLNTIKFN